ncbi:MAG: glycine cleavage system protein GcvH [Actinomycetes bacterium]
MIEKKYSKKHEWLEVNGNIATVGITVHAAAQLGDIVFAEIPAVGKSFKKDEAAAVVESVKAASDVYSPLTGDIKESNQAIVSDPSLVNKDPENSGWFFKITIKDQSELKDLMNKSDYEKYATENPN